MILYFLLQKHPDNKCVEVETSSNAEVELASQNLGLQKIAQSSKQSEYLRETSQPTVTVMIKSKSQRKFCTKREPWPSLVVIDQTRLHACHPSSYAQSPYNKHSERAGTKIGILTLTSLCNSSVPGNFPQRSKTLSFFLENNSKHVSIEIPACSSGITVDDTRDTA